MKRIPILLVAMLVVTGVAAELRAEPIKLAFIGDSYTCGVGDGADVPQSIPEAQQLIYPACGANQPGQLGYFEKNPYLWQWGQIWSNYGYIPKLSWYLQNAGKQNQVVAVCCRGGATAKQALDEDCAKTIKAADPTHTFIFFGLNPDPNTQSDIAKIMKNIPKKKYCISNQGTCPAGLTPVDGNWVNVPRTCNPPGVTWPCYPPSVKWCPYHPNRIGYWKMAWNVWNSVNKLGQW